MNLGLAAAIANKDRGSVIWLASSKISTGKEKDEMWVLEAEAQVTPTTSADATRARWLAVKAAGFEVFSSRS
jgi:hypothetical protein